MIRWFCIFKFFFSSVKLIGWMNGAESRFPSLDLRKWQVNDNHKKVEHVTENRSKSETSSWLPSVWIINGQSDLSVLLLVFGKSSTLYRHPVQGKPMFWIFLPGLCLDQQEDPFFLYHTMTVRWNWVNIIHQTGEGAFFSSRSYISRCIFIEALCFIDIERKKRKYE